MTEKTCNQFIHEMRDAGFDFTFTAISGGLVVNGKCKGGQIEVAKEINTAENKNKIIENLRMNREFN